MSILDRNVALVAPEGFEVYNIKPGEKIIEVLKGEVDSLLCKDDVKKGYYYSRKYGIIKLEDEEGVNHDFSMVSNKEKIIKKNINRIKYDILFNGKTKNIIDLELCKSYVKLGLIKRIDIYEWLRTNFAIKSRQILNYILSGNKTKDDLYLLNIYFLSYGLNNNLYSVGDKLLLEKVIEDLGIELEYILGMIYHYDFLDSEINQFI
ncbi:MAG: hypothetical protein PHV23_04325 [Candidatus Gracilibacteria bacterium]|nr:hypothetical protein [Candidatus Gracilibacteria bacterium]